MTVQISFQIYFKEYPKTRPQYYALNNDINKGYYNQTSNYITNHGGSYHNMKYSQYKAVGWYC